jgi:diacylglycerol kinase
MHRRRGIIGSFGAAAWGLLHTVATQPHMKVHVTSAVMVMIVGMSLPLGLEARIALLFSVALIFFAEVLNSALESFVDLHIKDFERLAMIAKDAAAGGVLVLSIATVLVLASILYSQWDTVVANEEAVLRGVFYGIPLTIVVITALWGPNKAWFKAILTAGAVALGLPLWRHSTDPVFSVSLGILILLVGISRPRPTPPWVEPG